MQKDFHPPLASEQKNPRRWPARLTVIGGLVVLLAALIGLFGTSHGPDLEARETPLKVDAPAAATSSGQAEKSVAPPPPEPVVEEFKYSVPTGASVTSLLGDYFSPQDIHRIDQRCAEIFPLTGIVAGHVYRIVTIDGRFDRFIYEIDQEEQLLIARDGDQFIIEREPIVYEKTLELIRGTITSSLFETIAEIGEKPALAYVLADIFGWDINFILDIRKGDTFQALVEKRFRDGRFAGYGKVRAAEFVNQGQVFEAVRFKDGDSRVGFYNGRGENLRKAFLKAPLSFTRISSGYSWNRLHPILNTRRPHLGIDYAAPVGTPVKTVGDGTIFRRGYTKGNGNYLKVRHSNGYISMYLHLKGFARGIRQGARVTQGQVIGYVGSTGMSTGPHLDFRMTRHGKPINPLKLDAPAEKSVSKAHLAEFNAVATPLLTRLVENREQATQVADLSADAEGSSEPGTDASHSDL